MSWLKAHPVSALSRSSCDLQILDAAIVEKIEEEIDKCKVHKILSKLSDSYHNILQLGSKCYLNCY